MDKYNRKPSIDKRYAPDNTDGPQAKAELQTVELGLFGRRLARLFRQELL